MDELSKGLRIASAAVGLVVVAAAGLLFQRSAIGAGSQVPTLTVTFNADGSVSVVLGDGTPVGTPGPPGTLIPAGTYQVVVNNPYRDDADIVHRFDLTGPGVQLVTDMNEGEELQDAWTETFQPSSTYTYEDDYATSIHGVFRTTATVTATGGSSSTSTASPGGQTVSNTPAASNGKTSASGTAIGPAPFRGVLQATVKPTGRLAFTRIGRPVTSLTAGRYRITVRDSSKQSGFVLQKSRSAARTLTSPKFVGSRTATIDLEVGQWFFYSTVVGRKSYFIVVAAT